MQNNQKIIALFGPGFIATHLMRNLTKLDYRIKVGSRNPFIKGSLKPLGAPGQIEIFKCNIFNQEDVKNVLKGCDIAINLVGILHETRKQKFHHIHSHFPYLLSNLCNELEVKKLVHVSALGSEKSASKYIQSKLQGEKNIKENFKSSVLLRPGIVIGPGGDGFFERFASIAQFSPFLPLIGGGKTKFAPIYVGDLCKAIVKILELNNSEPTTYELAGPEIYSFKQLMEILLAEIKKKRLLIPISFGSAKFLSYCCLQVLPGPLKITPDQIETQNKSILTKTKGDHRICMSSVILSLITGIRTKVKNFETVNTSFPGFIPLIKNLGAKVEIKKN